MSEFNRENRYIVIKRSDLANVPVNYRAALVDPLNRLQAHLPRRECLVIESDWPEYETAWRMIEARVTGAQPAEAQGAGVVAYAYIDETPEDYLRTKPFVVFAGPDGVAPGPAMEHQRLEPLVRLSALQAVTAERDRLREEKGDPAGSFEKCMQAMRDRDEHARTIDHLRAVVEALRKDAERWRYVRLQGDDTHWLNLLRVDLDEFGGNINAAVDALIDGEAPAMAAKEA